MEDSLKELVQHYKAVESHRNNLIDDLKRLANEVKDRAERTAQSSKEFNVDEHLLVAKREAKKLTLPGEMKNQRLRATATPSTSATEPTRSFFDEVA